MVMSFVELQSSPLKNHIENKLILVGMCGMILLRKSYENEEIEET